MGCCAEKKAGPETYEESRNCTDILCLLLFIAFWGGFIAVAAVGYANGDPSRITRPADYLGYYCGGKDVPPGFSSYIPSYSQWQSPNWADNDKVFYPVPSGSVDISTIVSSGVCVSACPSLNATAFSDISAGSDPTKWSAATLASVSVYTYGNTSRQGQNNVAPPVQYVMYSTSSFYSRCLPNGVSTSSTANTTLSKLPSAAEVQTFFYRGMYETANCWRVFLIVFFVALVMCFVYTTLMRLFIGVLVWTVIVCVFVLLLLAGYAAYSRFNALNSQNSADNANDAQYVRFYEAAAVISWVAAFIFIVGVIFLRKRIRMACAVIKVAGRVMTSAPGLLIVPVVVCILVLGVIAWCLTVAVYIYTSESFTVVPSQIQFLNSSLPYCSGNKNCFASVNRTILSTDNTRRNLLFYDLFGFLWTMGFFNAIGFVIVSFVTVFWYFSTVVDKDKSVPSGGICKATRWTLWYHMGTIAFGSLIIAIIQFIRIVVNYFAMKAKGIKENDVAKCILCVLNCCLACFERIVQVISKNAYILMCITSDNFINSALTATDYLLQNTVTIAILEVIAELVTIVGKLFIVAGSILIGYILMNSPTLAPGVDTRILPLIFIGFGAYFLASIFFNVYSVAVDANLMCFCHDRARNETSAVKYVPAELAHQIEGYAVPTSQQEAYAKTQAGHHS